MKIILVECNMSFPSSADILESFDTQHPLVLPGGGYQFQLRRAVTDLDLSEQLDKLKGFISLLPKPQSTEVTTTVEHQVQKWNSCRLILKCYWSMQTKQYKYCCAKKRVKESWERDLDSFRGLSRGSITWNENIRWAIKHGLMCLTTFKKQKPAGEELSPSLSSHHICPLFSKHNKCDNFKCMTTASLNCCSSQVFTPYLMQHYRQIVDKWNLCIYTT